MIAMTGSAAGLEIHYRHEVLHIMPWGTDSVRVRAAQYRLPVNGVGALDAPPLGTSEAVVKVIGNSATVTHGEVTVRVEFSELDANPEPSLTFTRTSTGEILLAESREHAWTPGARFYQGNRSGSWEIHQQFEAYANERLYGLGQRTHGRLNIKGLSLDLVQRNAEVNIPFVLSSRGYGFLWNMPGIGRVEFAENATRWSTGQAHEIDYWFCAAPTPAEILERYADATGHVPELPGWASGFWQSKLRYRNQEELLAVAREYTRRGLPLAVIVVDYFHWTAMGDYRFDPKEWPDPRGMVDELRSLGIETMVSIWPTISPLSENYEEYRDLGLLVGSDQGIESLQSIRDKGMTAPMPVGFYDATNPATRDFVWELVRDNYLSLGINLFWLDADEPELNPAHPGNVRFHVGPGAEVANIYPRDNARLFADGMSSEGRKPTVLLSRSAWAGSQKYGAAVWSGDIPATWESLAKQVRAGLNIAVSGIPWWTTDIGGFHGGDSTDPAYRELMVRWFQYGVFCPLFRLHGDREPRTPTGHDQTGGPNEVWSFGEQAFEIISAQLLLRERLRPYIHEQMALASKTGRPPMRPLFIDFPADPNCWLVDDQFMFGPDILVSPVLEAGSRARDVYLPAGSKWTNAWTGDIHDGGQTIIAGAPLECIPVFLTEGSLLPIRP